MQTKSCGLSFITVIFFIVPALLFGQANFSQPIYAGSGCNSGAMSVSFSPDARALTLLFDEFLLEAGDFAQREHAFKSCNLIIPMNIVNSSLISAMAVDARGFNFLPCNSYATFLAKYALSGQITRPDDENFIKNNNYFHSPKDDSYTAHNELGKNEILWSNSGPTVLYLHVAFSIDLRNTNEEDDAQSVLDSVDMAIN